MKRAFIILGVAIVSVCVAAIVFSHAADRRGDEARGQVTRWAEQLHAQTTDAGVYVRHAGDQLPENDPWGTPLAVAYTRGGFAETLAVRSAGPDRAWFTHDDIVEQRSVVNLKGIGKGAKENVEEFAHDAARGLATGAVEGLKEAVQPARKKN